MQSENFRYLHISRIPDDKYCPLIERFAHVACKPYALLFDSAGSQDDNNRYSMMMWSPAYVVTSQHKRTLIHDVNSKQHLFVQHSAFDTIDDFFAQWSESIKAGDKSQDLISILPFQCGLAGYAGYDEGREMLNIPSDKRDYQSPDCCVCCYSQSVIVDNLSGEQYICYITFQPKPDKDPFERLPKKQIRHDGKKFSLSTSWRSNMSEERYMDAFAAIQRYLIAGDCYQTNFAQRFSAKFEGDPFDAYIMLRNHNNAPFSCFLRLPKSAIISLSPERFLSVRDGKVETKPIKGTRPRSPNRQKDASLASELLNSEKDRAENLMIVDLLRNDLSKHCLAHSVRVPSLFALESYKAVHHLVSTVVGEIDKTSSPLQLLKDAFPGGSITGAPKVRAMEIIEELEPDKRAIYCGSMFYVGWQNDMDSNICIRTLLAEDDTLYCWAGGGIVIESEAKAEYQETFDKVAKILPILDHK